MPQLNTIPEVLYQPSQPYHYLYDNLPLKNILARINLVNLQTDNNAAMLLGTAGSVGSLSDRLDVSLEEDGSLKPGAVDSALHNIAYHEDGEKDGVEYVRMRAEERSKLSMVESEANFLTIEVGEYGIITNGNVKFSDSSSVEFRLDSPNVIRAHSRLPADAAHRHIYNMEPAHQNTSVHDWKSFMTTALGTPYIEGSLRVYVNGVRIGEGTYAPIFSGSSTPSSWMLFSVDSEDHMAGKFVLNSAIPQPGNNIIIDFDILVGFAGSSSSSSSHPGSSSSSHSSSSSNAVVFA